MEKMYRAGEHVNFKYAKGKTDIFGRSFHPYYELFLLLGGEVEFVNSHTRQTVRPYQLIVVPPGEYHQLIVSENVDAYERCVLNIDAALFEPNVLQTALAGKETLTLVPSHRIAEQFLYLVECLSAVDEADFAHILTAVGTDIVFLIKRYTEQDEPATGTLHDISLKLIRYVDEHYTETIDLSALAEQFHFSVSSLCHIFKKDFGISIKKYISQKRIHAAHVALQQGQRPESVSVAYGFPNYSTFFRAYRKCFGIAPSKSVAISKQA